MKVIFLDIDGVLNSEQYHYKCEFTDRYDLYRKQIDLEAVHLLREIVDKTGAEIVLSSCWRIGKTSRQAVETILKENGMSLFDSTGVYVNDSPRMVRGNEILQWMIDNERHIGYYFDFKSYVILDDDSDMLLQQKDNFIHIDRRVGLTEKDVERAIEILNCGGTDNA